MQRYSTLFGMTKALQLFLHVQRRSSFRNSIILPSITHFLLTSIHSLVLPKPRQILPRTYPLCFLSSDEEIHPFFAHSDPHFEEKEFSIPDPPTTCCMSGCAHCVWIEYAKELAAIYKDGGQAAEKVMKAIEDPSLKIFLSLELKEALKDSN